MLIINKLCKALSSIRNVLLTISVSCGVVACGGGASQPHPVEPNNNSQNGWPMLLRQIFSQESYVDGLGNVHYPRNVVKNATQYVWPSWTQNSQFSQLGQGVFLPTAFPLQAQVVSIDPGQVMNDIQFTNVDTSTYWFGDISDQLPLLPNAIGQILNTNYTVLGVTPFYYFQNPNNLYNPIARFNYIINNQNTNNNSYTYASIASTSVDFTQSFLSGLSSSLTTQCQQLVSNNAAFVSTCGDGMIAGYTAEAGIVANIQFPFGTDSHITSMVNSNMTLPQLQSTLQQAAKQGYNGYVTISLLQIGGNSNTFISQFGSDVYSQSVSVKTLKLEDAANYIGNVINYVAQNMIAQYIDPATAEWEFYTFGVSTPHVIALDQYGLNISAVPQSQSNLNAAESVMQDASDVLHGYQFLTTFFQSSSNIDQQTINAYTQVVNSETNIETTYLNDSLGCWTPDSYQNCTAVPTNLSNDLANNSSWALYQFLVNNLNYEIDHMSSNTLLSSMTPTSAYQNTLSCMSGSNDPTICGSVNNHSTISLSAPMAVQAFDTDGNSSYTFPLSINLQTTSSAGGSIYPLYTYAAQYGSFYPFRIMFYGDINTASNDGYFIFHPISYWIMTQ